MKRSKVVKCDACGADITDKIQVYPLDGRVLCEQDNWREGEETKEKAPD